MSRVSSGGTMSRKLITLSALVLFSFSMLSSKPLQFLVFGDWGWNGYFGQKLVAEQMEKRAEAIEAEFIVSCGDNFQINGVRSVDDPLWISSFENIYAAPSLLVDWYCVLGNHDYIGNPQAEIDYSKKSRRWNMPARFYAEHDQIDDRTDVDSYYLDTSPFQKQYYKEKRYANVIGQDTSAQLRWLDSALAASKSRWKIVVGHHPIFTSGTHAPELTAMPGRFNPLLRRYSVDAYFSGHDHQLECLKPDSGNLRYFISGGGSQMIRPVKPTAHTVFLACTPGFMVVSLGSDTMKVEVVDFEGKKLHTETIVK